MKNWLKGILIILMLAAPLGGGHAAMLRLGGMQFDPVIESAGKKLIPGPQAVMMRAHDKIPDRSDPTALTREAGHDYYIVQFEGPILPRWRQSLEQAGAAVLDYLPDFAYIVRLPKGRTEGVNKLPHVRWVGPYAPDFRLSLEAKALAAFSPERDTATSAPIQTRLGIDAFPGEDSAAITARIKGLDGRIETMSESRWGTRISAVLPAGKIGKVAGIPGVKWVEIRKTHRVNNNIAGRLIGINRVRSRTIATNPFGQGQVVAICDSGLDKGSATDIHPDFLDANGGSTRVLDIFRWGDFNSSRDTSGHGTHVAGSVLGNGHQSGANPGRNWFPETSFAGMAPRAFLVFQAVGTPESHTSNLPGIPADLKKLFQQARDASADIHTNSWGSRGIGDYNGESADVDQFCWDNKDYLILFAAGNTGKDRDHDGVIDQYSLDTPGTAKNCLTVGASESLRTTGGFAGHTYGEHKYDTDPMASDLLSDNPMGLAAFSSRGPCLDGRTKPDMVAPGTNIISTRSSAQETDAWGAFNDWYFYSGGTSMATPVTAGAAAVLRGYLTSEVDLFRKTPPSSAMLKACLVNGAVNMAPGQYGSALYREISKTPGPAAGWGRLSLDRSVNPEPPYFITYADNATGLGTQEENQYRITDVTGTDRLRVTLAWTDYPSATAANGGLVNDLDLMVTDRNGQVYYPDRARTQTAMDLISYYDEKKMAAGIHAGKIALRLTPDRHPSLLSSLGFGACKMGDAQGTIEVAVYQADENGAPAGPELFSKTLHNVVRDAAEDQWAMAEAFIPVNIEVVKGDVVAVFTFSNSRDMGLLGTSGDDGGRVLVDKGSGWEPAPLIPAVGGVFFSTNPSETFDRVNNLVGVTIDAPSGGYTVTVRGYNVPHGPQPFALVISGTKAQPPTPWGPDYPPLWRERR